MIGSNLELVGEGSRVKGQSRIKQGGSKELSKEI